MSIVRRLTGKWPTPQYDVHSRYKGIQMQASRTTNRQPHTHTLHWCSLGIFIVHKFHHNFLSLDFYSNYDLKLSIEYYFPTGFEEEEVRINCGGKTKRRYLFKLLLVIIMIADIFCCIEMNDNLGQYIATKQIVVVFFFFTIIIIDIQTHTRTHQRTNE